MEQFQENSPTMAPPAPEAPQPQYPYYQTPQAPMSRAPEVSTNQIQEIAETIVEEKWEELISKLGNIHIWKEKVTNDITSIKQEIIRTQDHFTQLQKAILGKVNDYNQNISGINTEMKALEQVLQKIIQPLSSNIKELSKITEKLKKKS
ncbi:MAG: hypothetical protein KJ674_03030 [Nanoarchaeota archaeon]|nr:hypothetical protein [Nanoarchaeota archaeon]